MNLTLLLFGERLSELVSWLYNHRKLINEEKVQVVGLYYIKDSGVKILGNRVRVYQGARRPFDRMIEHAKTIKTNLILPIASDDIILSLPDLKNYSSRESVLTGKIFFVEKNFYKPSVFNSFVYDRPEKEIVRNFWQFPYPGDNSILYSIFDKHIFFDLLYILKKYGEFHGSDWVFTHLLFERSAIRKCDGLLILREKTPSINYTKRAIRYGLRVLSIKNRENVLRLNPVFFLLKVIKLESVDPRFVKSLKKEMKHWVAIKYMEMLVAEPSLGEFYNKYEILSISGELMDWLETADLSELIALPT